MKKVSLEEKYILEYIRTMLSDAKIKSETVESDLFHHNSSYSKTPSIIRNGILSIKELNARGIERFSEKDLRILSDISSHINGSECVSLSLTGLKDLYQDESEYNPLTSLDTDILVSKEITARRSTEHYGNEYLVSESITPDKFKSVDLRLLKLYEDYIKEKVYFEKGSFITNLIERYNKLREIAQALYEEKLDIPLREMSEGNMTLDIDKIKKNPVLVLK